MKKQTVLNSSFSGMIEKGFDARSGMIEKGFDARFAEMIRT